MRSKLQESLKKKLLDGSNDFVSIVEDRVSSELDLSYIKVNDHGLVVPIDKPYSKEDMQNIDDVLNKSNPLVEIAYIFLKDGEFFARSHGNSEDLMSLSPAEMYVLGRTNEHIVTHDGFGDRKGCLQYFRLASKNVKKGLESIWFEEVSNIPENLKGVVKKQVCKGALVFPHEGWFLEKSTPSNRNVMTFPLCDRTNYFEGEE